MALASKQAATLEVAIFRAKEETLATFAREIHDNIGQLLCLLKINLCNIDYGTNTQIGEKMESSKSLISKAIQDLRNLSHGIADNLFCESGLIKATEHDLLMIQKSGLLKTEFRLECIEQRLVADSELILLE